MAKKAEEILSHYQELDCVLPLLPTFLNSLGTLDVLDSLSVTLGQCHDVTLFARRGVV
jgi:hypothetical protein